jgi:FCD domain
VVGVPLSALFGAPTHLAVQPRGIACVSRQQRSAHPRVALDLTQAAELYPLIETLEVFALEQPGPDLTSGDLERLERANGELRGALEHHDAAGAVAADNAFHDVWVERAGNRDFLAALRQFKLKLLRVELAYFDVEARAQRSLAEHATIVNALRARRWMEAMTAVRQNWRDSLERLRATSPDLFACAPVAALARRPAPSFQGLAPHCPRGTTRNDMIEYPRVLDKWRLDGARQGSAAAAWDHTRCRVATR